MLLFCLKWDINNKSFSFSDYLFFGHSNRPSPPCGRFPEEEAGELRADPGGAREDPEDGAALRSHQSQAEGGGCHQRSGHHLPGRSLRVHCRLARTPAGTHQRGQVGPQHGLACVFHILMWIIRQALLVAFFSYFGLFWKDLTFNVEFILTPLHLLPVQDSSGVPHHRRHQRRDLRVHGRLRHDLRRVQLEAEFPLVPCPPEGDGSTEGGSNSSRQVSKGPHVFLCKPKLK